MNEEYIKKLDRENRLNPITQIQSLGGQITDAEVIIPICCRENWDSCPHKVKRQGKIKSNIGL